MNTRTTRVVLLVALFALATSVAGFAQCGLPNEIFCQPWDGTGGIYASQNDTNGNGNYATVYDTFTLPGGVSAWDVESFHFYGGYFNPGANPFISAIQLTFYADNAGAPGGAIATGAFVNFNETFVGSGVYSYDLFFQSFDLLPGTPYWASVVGTVGFPPQWGWATGVGPGLGYQAFFSPPAPVGASFAFGIDGTAVPEPGTLIMLGTGILGLAGSLRRKLL
jgi:hypothetical protein